MYISVKLKTRQLGAQTVRLKSESKPRTKLKAGVIALVLGFLIVWIKSANSPTVSTEAIAYLSNALVIIQENSINRYRTDWDALEAEAYNRIREAQTPSDTYDTIQFVLIKLGDHHSFFVTPDQIALYRRATMSDNSTPRVELVEDNLGLVILPGFGSGDPEQMGKYATNVQHMICEIDAKNPCGWVVDLRENTGGNMWPMLAGIGPILGEGRAGAFIDPDGEVMCWSYVGGKALLEDTVVVEVDGQACELQEPSPPVAVLTSGSTASSGEAIVVAFRGRPNTRSFGSGTAGVSTANQGYELSDGAMILLTVATFVNRTGQTYGGVITPDELVGRSASESDPAMQAAINWLLNQPACIVER